MKSGNFFINLLSLVGLLCQLYNSIGTVAIKKNTFVSSANVSTLLVILSSK